MPDLIRLIPTEIIKSVERHVDGTAMVDVCWTAERIRIEHARSNIAREDIEMLVMRRATLQSVPMILGNLIEDATSFAGDEKSPPSDLGQLG